MMHLSPSLPAHRAGYLFLNYFMRLSGTWSGTAKYSETILLVHYRMPLEFLNFLGPPRNVFALIGQSAVCYCVSKSTDESRVL